jgi:hypothetical protein
LERIEQRELPGNDASWFQALLGEKGTPTAVADDVPRAGVSLVPNGDTLTTSAPVDEAIHTEELQQAPTADHDAVETPTDDGGASGEEPVHGDSEEGPLMTAVPELGIDEAPADPGSEAVGQPWTPPDSGGPMDGWEPEEMDRKMSSTRPFRWTSVGAAVAVVALIAVGLVLLPSITRNRASDHKEMFTTVLDELRGELPETQASLAIATDPASDTASLLTLATQLTALAAKTSAVDAASQADLPSTPPFTSSTPIDDLEPLRQRLEPLGSIATTIQRRISNVAEYRTLMAGFLALPELPVIADSAGQAELRVTLAAAQADSASILADLPSDVSLDAHRSLARDLNERFATWQIDYLEALRNGDSTTARDLLAELGDALADLDNNLVTPLAQIRRQTDADIIDLAASIDAVSRLVAGELPPP